MASAHELIVKKIQLKWSSEKLGRLYPMRQGKAIPINGYSPVDFGAGIKGFPDVFGFTFIDNKPVFTVIEVKTRRDTIRSEQRLFLDYMASIGAEVWLAREDDSADGYRLERWGK